MSKSQFKNYLLEQEKLLTQIIELEVKIFGSRKLAVKVGKPHNYFSVTMKRIKEEKYFSQICDNCVKQLYKKINEK